MADFSHIDSQGELRMVDISSKTATAREAVAVGKIRLAAETLRLVRSDGMKKGSVLAAARLAGIMAAKRTAHLIPLCHQIPLSNVRVEFDPGDDFIKIEAAAKCVGGTGVEMEALTAVAVAGLTIYDMCKGVDKRMVIGEIRLISKTGGKSDFSDT
ncbi:MAG: cyclic pyranopterin monophosphate synthase MoaC [bacterium]